MNSLSSFLNSSNPLVSYLEYMGNKATNIILFKHGFNYIYCLPSGLCSIVVNKGVITVDRKEICSISYTINTLEEAKELFSILVGVCVEHGYCYVEADKIVGSIYKLVSDHIKMKN